MNFTFIQRNCYGTGIYFEARWSWEIQIAASNIVTPVRKDDSVDERETIHLSPLSVLTSCDKYSHK